MTSHVITVESGATLGEEVHWARCSCSWLGHAASTHAEARIEGDNHARFESAA